MSKKALTFIALGAAVYLVSPDYVMAEEHMHQKHAERFAETDLNGDGMLSKEEMLKAHEKRLNEKFQKWDANKDGLLSKEELKEGRKEFRKKMKKHMEEKRDSE